jgi:DNA polymerase III subunit gamma/tau
MTTLYLKYRPQKIADLDLDGVRDGLAKIISSNRIPHAFLFSGPRGAGKTSTARILAKVVNCESRKIGGTPKDIEIEPCNTCETCVAITRGSSLDVFEIDAASNRGVDDIRSLRETVKLASTGGKKKVYIIDEAHMLTTEAANALLKTLEEPPDHVMFILATTAPEKLPDTIRSRCTTINFYKGGKAELVRSLKRVVEGEKFEVEDDALAALAGVVDGSFREAHKLLEQLSFDGKITIEGIRKLTSVVSANPEVLINYLAKCDSKSALDEINDIASRGVNLKVYATEVIGILRREMIAKVKGEKSDLTLSINEVQRLIELFSEAIKQIPSSVIPQLPIEMACVKYCVRDEPSVKASPVPDTVSKPAVATPRVTQAETKKVEKIDEAPEDLDIEPDMENDLGKVADLPENIEVVKIETQDLQKSWVAIMNGTKKKNNSVEALLRAARPIGYDGKILKIEVFYKFHKDKLESSPYRSLVEEVATSVLGSPSSIVCLLSQEKKRAADIANVVPPTPKDEEIINIAEQIFGGAPDPQVH